MGSWIATGILALLLIYASWIAVAYPVAEATIIVVLFAAATLLTAPPLWRGSSRNQAYIRFFVALMLTITALQIPIKTHAITLNIPSSSGSSNR